MPSLSKSEAIELARRDLAAYAAGMWPRFELAPHHRTLVSTLEAVKEATSTV